MSPSNLNPAPGWLRNLAVFASVLAAAVLPGLLLFVLGLVGPGEAPDAASANPGLVSEGLTDALVPLFISTIVGAVGFALVCFVAIFTRYRARWFFWSSLAFCVLYAPYLPYGTVMSVILLIFLIKKRREFSPQA